MSFGDAERLLGFALRVGFLGLLRGSFGIFGLLGLLGVIRVIVGCVFDMVRKRKKRNRKGGAVFFPLSLAF